MLEAKMIGHLFEKQTMQMGIPDKKTLFLVCNQAHCHYLRNLPKAPNAIKMLCAVCWSSKKQAITSQIALVRFPKSTCTSHSKKYDQNSHHSHTIIPCEKDQPRALASLPAGTKGPPQLSVSRRNFGTLRSEWPTRQVLSQHTCSDRPSHPQVGEG